MVTEMMGEFNKLLQEDNSSLVDSRLNATIDQKIDEHYNEVM